MDYENNKEKELIVTDSDMGVRNNSLNNDLRTEKKRAPKKDRSNNKYSEKNFLELSRDKQLALAEQYWNGPIANFEDGTFQFSYAHFVKLCEELGFRKGVIDTAIKINKENKNPILYIERGKRDNTEIKKLTLSINTIKKIDLLLGDKLSNIEKSKVIDALLSEVLDQKLQDKENGEFGVAYRPTEEERIL